MNQNDRKPNQRKTASSSERAEALVVAQEVLHSAAVTLESIRVHAGEEFIAAASLILELSQGGRLVCMGMGKAGFIAQKVSATFASIGIPSFFLHPAEAIHGDLGRFSKNDIALILSNSGETPEVVKIIPSIRQFRCPIIAITQAATTTLAKYSDVVLCIGTITEAGPMGLAPTTSTTAMLAVGDALAMAVYKLLGFSPEQFALLHPGGNLGRRLMLVSEIMRKGESHCVVSQDMLVRDVLHRITRTAGRPGAASIVDESGILVGVFTDGNLRRCLEKGSEFLDKPINEIMGNNPKVVESTRLVTEAMQVLKDHKTDQVIVIDDANKPIGLIDIQDLVEFRTLPEKS